MSDIEQVFDSKNKLMTINNPEIDKTLDDENNRIFHELMSFKEFDNLDDISFNEEEKENDIKSKLQMEFDKIFQDDTINNNSQNKDLEVVSPRTNAPDSISKNIENNILTPGGKNYKLQFYKALKLIKSLKKELENYKKMGRVVRYLNESKMNPEAMKEILSDDVKLIISDLREHIEEKEVQEMSLIQDNFKNLFKFIDQRYHKDFESFIEKIQSSKLSKQNAFKDFTDKIVTTIEEIEEDQSVEEYDDYDSSLLDISKRYSVVSSSKGFRTPRKSFEGTKIKAFNFKGGKGNSSRNLGTPKKLKHVALTLMNKIIKKKFIKDMMPKSQLFTVITLIYKIARDYIDKTHPDLPLHCFVYDFLLNKYGIKKIADKKFRQMCAAVKRIKDSNPRSYVFARFLGFFKPLSRKEFIK